LADKLKGYDTDEIAKLSEEVEKKLYSIFGENPIDGQLLEEVAVIHSFLEQSGKHEEIREDNLLLTVAFVVLSKLQYSKEGTYGRSWCKRGQTDTFFNLARKFDRLENIVINGAKDEVGESTVDTVGDLANYGLLWVTLFMRKDFDAFNQWLKNNLK
jgi:hypothetical protein